MSKKLIERALLILVISSAGACGKLFECSYTEKNRVSSPNKNQDYVHVKKNCDATVSIVDEVYLVLRGQDYRNFDPVLVADNVDEIRLAWENDSLIKIVLNGGRIFKFSNFSDVGNRRISIDIIAYSSPQSN